MDQIIKKCFRMFLNILILLLCFSFLAMPITTHAAPQEGSLYITSEPKGATVYVDNIKIGTTDLIISSITAGSHTIRLELRGYQKF